MTPYERIVNAIKPFGVDYAPDVYHGGKDKYFVYTTGTVTPAYSASNAPQAYIVPVVIHYVMPRNEGHFGIMKEIIGQLVKNGFSAPRVYVDTEGERKILKFNTNTLL